MVRQCLFCSWFGVRLKRHRFADGLRASYHPHCVRVALNSPDPRDRGRAEEIFRAEMPRLIRERYWEINPPNRTANPGVAVKDLSAQEYERVCREYAMNPAEAIRELLTPPSSEATSAQSLEGTTDSSGGGFKSLPPSTTNRDQRCLAARRLWEKGLDYEEIAEVLNLRAETVIAWERNGWRTRHGHTGRSNVDCAVELVSRFSESEMEEFRGRIARLTRCLIPEEDDGLNLETLCPAV